MDLVVASADDVHMQNIFIGDNRRLAYEVELGLTGGQCLGHKCSRNGAPGRGGGYIPGMSAAYENLRYQYGSLVQTWMPEAL